MTSRHWKKLISAVCVLAITVLAADLPAEWPTTTVTISWDANPPEDEVVNYRLYQSTSVAGPFSLVSEPQGTNAVLYVEPGQYFFYVTDVNFWGEGRPSAMTRTPRSLPGGVQTLRITRNQ